MRTLLSLCAFLSACSLTADTPTPPATREPAPLTMEGVPAQPVRPAYDGRFAADALLTPVDVAAIPTGDLRVVRNEVFARHGREFQSADLRTHFEGTPWYQADGAYTAARLTDNDRANVALIQSFEDGGGDPVAVGEFSGESRLVFVDRHTVELLAEDSMYEWQRTSRAWEARGQWVVTWSGVDHDDAALWRLDYANKSVTARYPLEHL